MHASLERGKRYESLDTSVARIAYAFGFTAPPVQIPKKSLGVTGDTNVSTSIALLKSVTLAKEPMQVWGTMRGPKGGSTLSFAVIASRHAVGNALVVEAARSVAELAGFSDLTVLVSSVGDQESRKRFTRELANFFRKNADKLPPDLVREAAHDPDATYRALIVQKDPLAERAPHPIDYLSENSRKIMLETLSLFESIGISYTVAPRLLAEPGVNTELLFAIEGTARGGERVRVAMGGRFDEYMRRSGCEAPAVSVSVMMPDRVDPEAIREEPAVYIVHVGDAAKLKAFAVLDTLWRSRLIVTQALMQETLREQIDRARGAGAKYLAIVGQREALDGTVIVRNLATQLQNTIPADKLVSYIGRGR